MSTDPALGSYRIESILGEGGMGVVYKAHDPDLRRFVVLKVIRSASITAVQRARFLQEARAASALNHPHIVQVYDLVRTADQDVIVMEYVEGDTLDRLVGRGLPLRDALRYGAQIADALAAAHAAGAPRPQTSQHHHHRGLPCARTRGQAAGLRRSQVDATAARKILGAAFQVMDDVKVVLEEIVEGTSGAAGGEPQLMLEDVGAATLSPDGRTLAFLRGASSNRSLWITPIDRLDPQRYETAPFPATFTFSRSLEFSSDGAQRRSHRAASGCRRGERTLDRAAFRGHTPPSTRGRTLLFG